MTITEFRIEKRIFDTDHCAQFAADYKSTARMMYVSIYARMYVLYMDVYMFVCIVGCMYVRCVCVLRKELATEHKLTRCKTKQTKKIQVSVLR
jgi:hypothetical protein